MSLPVLFHLSVRTRQNWMNSFVISIWQHRAPPFEQLLAVLPRPVGLCTQLHTGVSRPTNTRQYSISIERSRTTQHQVVNCLPAPMGLPRPSHRSPPRHRRHDHQPSPRVLLRLVPAPPASQGQESASSVHRHSAADCTLVTVDKQPRIGPPVPSQTVRRPRQAQPPRPPRSQLPPLPFRPAACARAHEPGGL